MSRKRESLILFLALLIALGIQGGLIWWLKERFFPGQTPLNRVATSPQSLWSKGERVLITSVGRDSKTKAAVAIAQNNYAEAVQMLELHVQQEANDPEALIYLNNARIGNNKAYVIAVVVPITSQLNPAAEILRGVAQAQNRINTQGGINGIPLQVIIADDQNQEAIALEIAKAMELNPEVLGVIGHFSSQMTLSVADIYEKHGLVLISPTSTAVELSSQGNYIFRTVPSDQLAAGILANYVLNGLQKTKIAVFYNSSSNYSMSLKQAFTTAIFSSGGEVLIDIDLTSPNFNAEESLRKIEALGVEVLMLAANSETLDQALLVIAQNRGRLAVIGGDSLYNPKILQLGGENAVGMVVAIPWHILADANSNFVQEANQLWKASVNWRTAMSYDATVALIAAIEKNPSRTGVQEILSESDFSTEGASGVVRFFPSGDRNQALKLVEVVPGNFSGFGYDFMPLVFP